MTAEQASFTSSLPEPNPATLDVETDVETDVEIDVETDVVERDAALSPINFNVADLVVGRRLQFPIYEPGGLLLLAEGSLVTARFKQLLVTRGIRAVILSQTDADSMASQAEPEACLPVVSQIDNDLAKKLDAMVDSGQLFMKDTGPPFRDRMIQHGTKGYSRERRELLLKEHTETCSALDAMIKAAVNGEPPSAEKIAAVVAHYMTNLTSDADCALDVARQAGHYAELSEHCLQMSLLGMAIGIEMGLAEEDIRNLGLSGLFHDWGMARVSPRIRNANRLITRAEFLEIQKHPIHTLEMLRAVSGIPSFVPLICYQVHERTNGTGYPRGRARDNIHPCARILHVADVYLALISPRPFRKPLMPYAAIECLLRQAREKMVDVDVVRALLQVLSLFPIGSLVRLSDGSTARVLRRNGSNYSSPIVLIVEDANGDPTDSLDESQVIDPSQHGLRIVEALSSPDRAEVGLSPDIQVLNRD